GLHGARAVDFDAVIPACDAIAEIPAERQTCAAVRATVFERVDFAVLIAPQHDLLAESRKADGRIAYLPARRDGIPVVLDAAVEVRLNRIGCGARCIKGRHEETPCSLYPGFAWRF